jgi:hypothetical protein
MAANLTDERLRYWLDGNQPSRERLCVALLALDRRFAHITPRRPRGGPDGGRDLEAFFVGEHEAWGAIGFRNSATDSPADKRWVKKKFAADLAKACEENENLGCFVFFTNIDLTPGEVASLQTAVNREGIAHCEIFYRERMRLLLDSVEGLAFRFQYLGIEMASAEQVAFFARWSNTIESNILRQFDVIDEKLSRLEFFHECTRPLRHLGVALRFRRKYSMDELRDLRVLVVTVAKGVEVESTSTGELLTLFEASAVTSASGSCVFETKFSFSSGPPHAQFYEGGECESFGDISELYLKGDFYINKPDVFSNLGDFDLAWLHFYISKGVVECVYRIDYFVNGFVLASDKIDDLVAEPAPHNDKYLNAVGVIEGKPEWLEIVDGPKGGESIPPLCYVDYSAYSPMRAWRRKMSPYSS